MSLLALRRRKYKPLSASSREDYLKLLLGKKAGTTKKYSEA